MEISLEEYRTQLKKWIEVHYGIYRANEEMEIYGDEINEYYKEGWSIEGLGSAMVSGLL